MKLPAFACDMVRAVRNIAAWPTRWGGILSLYGQTAGPRTGGYAPVAVVQPSRALSPKRT